MGWNTNHQLEKMLLGLPQGEISLPCCTTNMWTWRPCVCLYIIYRVVKGGVPRGGGSLMFPKVPQSSLGILRVPQLPPPLEYPPLKNPINNIPPNWVIHKNHEWPFFFVHFGPILGPTLVVTASFQCENLKNLRLAWCLFDVPFGGYFGLYTLYNCWSQEEMIGRNWDDLVAGMTKQSPLPHFQTRLFIMGNQLDVREIAAFSLLTSVSSHKFLLVTLSPLKRKFLAMKDIPSWPIFWIVPYTLNAPLSWSCGFKSNVTDQKFSL